MKKKSTSCVRLTGLMASAYAAGSPRTKTRIVEPMLAIAELMKNGGKSPDSTVWNSSRVGRKRMVGGRMAGGGCVLSDSSHIHRTGKKKMNTTSQPTIDHATFLVGNWNRPPASTLALNVGPPREKSKTACAAQRSQRS